jgi:hypothetical protein
MHYRYERAVLAGSRFGVWLARLVGVKPKIVKMDLTKEELKKLHPDHPDSPPADLGVPETGIQDVLPNGDTEK